MFCAVERFLFQLFSFRQDGVVFPHFWGPAEIPSQMPSQIPCQEFFDPNIPKTPRRYSQETEKQNDSWFVGLFHCAVARIWSLLMQRHASMKWRCEWFPGSLNTVLVAKSCFVTGEPNNILLILSHYTCRILYCPLKESDVISSGSWGGFLYGSRNSSYFFPRFFFTTR